MHVRRLFAVAHSRRGRGWRRCARRRHRSRRLAASALRARRARSRDAGERSAPRTRTPRPRARRASTRSTAAATRRRRASALDALRGAPALSTRLGSILVADARREVGRDHRLAHARRHALRAERRRDDAARVDDEDVHVGRRARPLRPRLHFRTAVLRDGTVGPDGTLAGNLYLRGVGDPSLQLALLARRKSRWTRSRSRSPRPASSTCTATSSATRARSTTSSSPTAGRRSYLGAAYAARVSALSLNENLVWVVVQPSGKTASVTLEPATTTIPVDEHRAPRRRKRRPHQRVRARRRHASPCAARSARARGRSSTRSSSTIRRCSPTGALRAALQKAGITVDGTTRSAPTPASADEGRGARVAAARADHRRDGSREHQHRRRAAVPRRRARAAPNSSRHRPRPGSPHLRDFMYEEGRRAPPKS